MAWPNWLYNSVGELSPAQKQAAWDEVYKQVIQAGGTDADARAAANQATGAQVTGETGSYWSAYYNTLTNKGGAAGIAGDELGHAIEGVGETIKSAVDSVSGVIGDAVGNVVSGKVLLGIALIVVGLYFWKR